MNFFGAKYDPDILREIVSLELRAHGLNVAVTRPKDLPQVWSLLARGAFGTKPETVKRLGDSLAEKTGVDAASIHQMRHGLVVVLAKPDPLRRALSTGELLRTVLASKRPLGRLAVPVGLSVLGEPVTLDLADATSPHAAILGATGSGKSELARWLLFWLAFRNGPAVRLLAYSPKPDYADLYGCASMAHPPIQSPSEALRLLAWLVAELDNRMANGTAEPRVVAMFDEVPTLLKAAPDADGMLDRIAAAGRAVGIHLLLGSQQAGKAEASGAMANMPARLVGRVSSGTLSYVTSGKSGTEADKLLGRGDFYLVRHDAVRLQAPLLGVSELERLPYVMEPAELDLPDVMPVTQQQQRRGGSGWNASEVSEAAVMDAFDAGATLREVMEQFGLGFTRAKRFQAQHTEVMTWND
ncbi:FtsK/SpoIIIE domain-containing protein [Ottowia sp.]|uniref:FtsK/SpoIIIE domain-containing protein n=1 Tax=Ottowia sp. TaxID=1898956 RepID=UPI002B6F805A|nr:FtsK/SpoIIIE domain-containing protein [Ottowia sp.]HNR84715.1 FtsK/SpoIIIE domain-containing protein [Ottowia sp.]